jgi:hypothetical protein
MSNCIAAHLRFSVSLAIDTERWFSAEN